MQDIFPAPQADRLKALFQFFDDLVSGRIADEDIASSRNVAEGDDPGGAGELAELFKMFADSTRIKILYDLFDGEKNVSEICEDIEMNQSAVSHQLKALKTGKLIKSRREGKAIYYSLDDDHVKTIIEMGKEHIGE